MSKKPEPVIDLNKEDPYKCQHDTLIVRKLIISRSEYSKQPKDPRDVLRYRQAEPDNLYYQEVLTVYCKKCGEPLHTKVLG